jgi:hypothetical protein
MTYKSIDQDFQAEKEEIIEASRTQLSGMF